MLQNYFDLKKSFVFYGAYHREWRNQLIHILCVPCIYTTSLQFASGVKLGSTGIEKIYEIALNDEEKAMLAKSAGAVQELVDVLKKNG